MTLSFWPLEFARCVVYFWNSSRDCLSALCFLGMPGEHHGIWWVRTNRKQILDLRVKTSNFRNAPSCGDNAFGHYMHIWWVQRTNPSKTDYRKKISRSFRPLIPLKLSYVCHCKAKQNQVKTKIFSPHSRSVPTYTDRPKLDFAAKYGQNYGTSSTANCIAKQTLSFT